MHSNISGYVQVTEYGDRASFEPREIIHVSLDAARPGVTGLSPMQAALGPVTAWLFAQATAKESFKKGLPPNIHADHPAATEDKDIRRWRDQYLTKNVGSRNIGAPITSKGGVNLKELATGKIADVIAGKNQARDEILSIFGVPPGERRGDRFREPGRWHRGRAGQDVPHRHGRGPRPSYRPWVVLQLRTHEAGTPTPAPHGATGLARSARSRPE